MKPSSGATEGVLDKGVSGQPDYIHHLDYAKIWHGSTIPGSGTSEGVLDKGVSGQPDYIHRPDYRSVKIQDSRLRLVSGWALLCVEDKLGDPDIVFPSL